jgi:hypothetical protein
MDFQGCQNLGWFRFFTSDSRLTFWIEVHDVQEVHASTTMKSVLGRLSLGRPSAERSEVI